MTTENQPRKDEPMNMAYLAGGLEGLLATILYTDIPGLKVTDHRVAKAEIERRIQSCKAEAAQYLRDHPRDF